MSVTGSTSERNQKKGKGCLGCFFGIFLLIGLGATGAMLWPIVGIFRAKEWRETPCTILASEVQTHRSKGSLIYSVELSYEYFVEDQRYVSTRYKFMTSSSSGYDSKAEIVQRLAPGTKTVCYVDKRNPAEAVIERGFTSDIFLAFIPMIFAVIGGGGIYGVFFYKGKPKTVRPNAGMPAAAVTGPTPGRTTLKASTSPGVRLGCSIIFALFWNGILSFFVADVISGWSNGKGDGCSTVFMIPFVLIGVGLFVLVLYCFLAMFNPRPTVTVSASSAALGEMVELEWEMSGNVDRIKVFTVLFEGREEATYRRGTTTSTDKSVFETIELAKITEPRDMRRGKVKVVIPMDTMHTFKSGNNKILWHFQVKGDIPKWPDVDESYDFEVLPFAVRKENAS
jgi:hypothetical protein